MRRVEVYEWAYEKVPTLGGGTRTEWVRNSDGKLVRVFKYHGTFHTFTTETDGETTYPVALIEDDKGNVETVGLPLFRFSDQSS